MTKWTSLILLLSGLYLAACMAKAPGTPASTLDEGRSPVGDAPLVSVRTDKQVYRAGESILVTIGNNATRPVQFMGLCSLHLCQMTGEDWVCVEQECDGPLTVLDPGSQMDLVMEAQAIVRGECRDERCSRYKLDYRVVSEDGVYFAHSEEFAVQRSLCIRKMKTNLRHGSFHPDNLWPDPSDLPVHIS